ncbi:MAG: BlaI/MecI/CopY family transcriptional regulator [Bacilli bacterium]
MYKISEAEWAVMEVLWRKSGMSLKEIAEALAHTDWAYSTIRTLVKRLHEKGMIEADRTTPGNFKYSACVAAETCKLSEVEGFLDRVFGGSVSMLVATLAKRERLDKKDIDELKQLIDEWEEN